MGHASYNNNKNTGEENLHTRLWKTGIADEQEKDR